jgi:hypothetical protein
MNDSPVYTVPRPRRRVGRAPEVASCACTPDRLCLWHYSQLDPGRQARDRRQADVHEQYLGDRRR